MDENPPAGSPAVVITWRVLPSVCTAACAIFLLLALIDAAAGSERIIWGIIAVFFAAGALSGFRRRYALSQGQLVIRRVFTRHRIILSELTSVEAVRMITSRGRVYWHLL